MLPAQVVQEVTSMTAVPPLPEIQRLASSVTDISMGWLAPSG
jgi:hypothetical protein